MVYSFPMDSKQQPLTANDHIVALMHAMPTPAAIQAATEKELEEFRSLSNILANLAYLERARRGQSAK